MAGFTLDQLNGMVSKRAASASASSPSPSAGFTLDSLNALARKSADRRFILDQAVVNIDGSPVRKVRDAKSGYMRPMTVSELVEEKVAAAGSGGADVRKALYDALEYDATLKERVAKFSELTLENAQRMGYTEPDESKASEGQRKFFETANRDLAKIRKPRFYDMLGVKVPDGYRPNYTATAARSTASAPAPQTRSSPEPTPVQPKKQDDYDRHVANAPTVVMLDTDGNRMTLTAGAGMRRATASEVEEGRRQNAAGDIPKVEYKKIDPFGVL